MLFLGRVVVAGGSLAYSPGRANIRTRRKSLRTGRKQSIAKTRSAITCGRLATFAFNLQSLFLLVRDDSASSK